MHEPKLDRTNRHAQPDPNTHGFNYDDRRAANQTYWPDRLLDGNRYRHTRANSRARGGRLGSAETYVYRRQAPGDLTNPAGRHDHQHTYKLARGSR